MYKATFVLKKENIFDTYIKTRYWGKGVVFVNGFNIGRYFNVGPQMTLYVPAPLLQPGLNTVLILIFLYYFYQ